MTKVRLVIAFVAISGCMHQDSTVEAPKVVSVPEVNATPDPSAIRAVTDAEIESTLAGRGDWVTLDGTRVWRPYATEVGVDFTPYETCGSWVWTNDAGWVFGCDWSWGWLPFHYGQWGWFGEYWAWVPGHEWSPAWVEWRAGGGYVGWRPAVPRSQRAQARESLWRFMTVEDFGKRNIRAHLFKHAAEGLRVTSITNGPPVRGTVHAVTVASVMRH